MKTLHCIDVSGSMSNSQIELAKHEALKRFGPQDTMVIFDTAFKEIKDYSAPLKNYRTDDLVGIFNPSKVLDFAAKIGAKTILYSDGYLTLDEVAKFGELVEIK